MESELYDAAVKGDVASLLKLLAKDELLLDRIMTGNETETPLHIAAMLGHLDFVDQILARKPEMARQQDSQNSTPLHLAAAKGDLNIVTSLLRASPEMCFVRDKYKRNPLHIAAMKGYVDVLEHLVRARSDAAHSVVEHGQTILHLCVKHNKLEALKLLIDILGDDQLFNSKDEDGDTILHLAAADRQTETVDFLINKGVSPTIKNSRGFTAFGLLAQGGIVERAIEIKGYAPQTSENHHPSGPIVCTNKTDIHPPVGEEDEGERNRKWANSMQKALLVVATLLATMSYQASITPPGGLWQDDSKNNDKNNIAQKLAAEPPHYAGESILAYKHTADHNDFVICNTSSFVASLSVIMLLISGLPLKRRRITTWMAMLIMWVAITFTAATYAISISDSAPGGQSDIVQYAVFAWVGLMTLIFLCHVIRLIVKLVRAILKFICGVLKIICRTLTGRGPEEEQKKRPQA